MVLAGGCATAPVVRLGEGQLPETLQIEEMEILEQVRQELHLLEEKGALYHDLALETYLSEIGRRLVPAGHDAPGVAYQFHIIRDPTLNAFAAPTGDIYVHTGLLARLQTQGELADILGHEASHVYSRDTLYRMVDYKQKTVTWKIADLVFSPALTFFGLGGLGELGLGLIYATSVTGYSREQEGRADKDGVEQVRAAGYDPREGIRAWNRFLEEKERYQKGVEIFFLASHPNTRWRKAQREEWLTREGLSSDPGEANDPDYLLATAGVRKENARLNLRLRRHFHAVDDLTGLLDHHPQDAEARALLGDAYRGMADDPRAVQDELSDKAWGEFAKLKEKERVARWRGQAEEAYGQALEQDAECAEAHRGFGFLLASDEARREDAVAHLTRYLEIRPEASDRRFVSSRLDRLAKSEPEGAPTR